MKSTITIKGKIYDSGPSIVDKYGISYTTLIKWAERGVLPPPAKLGRKKFYEREAVENRLLGETP